MRNDKLRWAKLAGITGKDRERKAEHGHPRKGKGRRGTLHYRKVTGMHGTGMQWQERTGNGRTGKDMERQYMTGRARNWEERPGKEMQCNGVEWHGLELKDTSGTDITRPREIIPYNTIHDRATHVNERKRKERACT